jgi:hypothetical protein
VILMGALPPHRAILKALSKRAMTQVIALFCSERFNEKVAALYQRSLVFGLSHTGKMFMSWNG